MAIVYLTRRNLETLLSKLDRKASGDESACTLVKRDTTHSKYPCSQVTYVIALENAEYYTNRPAGRVYPEDEVKLS